MDRITEHPTLTLGLYLGLGLVVLSTGIQGGGGRGGGAGTEEVGLDVLLRVAADLVPELQNRREDDPEDVGGRPWGGRC